MRTEIQNRILVLCQTGTFPTVSYDATTKIATESTTEVDTPRVVVNEISGALTRSVKAGARSGQASMQNWVFEARLKFKHEVSVDYFLKNELKMVSFVKDNERVTVVSTGFPIGQPPRQKPHNGTEMVLTFSVNTRR